MSTYTLGEITAWLVLAAVLGFVLGWLVREIQLRASRRRTGSSPAEVVTPPQTRREPDREPDPDREPEPDLEPDREPEPEPDPEPEPEPTAEPEPERLIKGKTKSMIYHTPQSSSYNRTKADVWFATEDEAVAAGYRKPKKT